MGILEEKDMGLERILKEVDRFKDSYVAVGFFEDQTHKGKDGEEDLPVAGIAAVHEYGAEITLPNGTKLVIPQRSFIRAWATEHQEQIAEVVGELYNLVLEGDMGAKKALQLLGQYGVAGIKRKIDQGPFTPLSELTVLRKGSSKPLIDTAQMRNSVRSEVRTGEIPEEGVA